MSILRVDQQNLSRCDIAAIARAELDRRKRMLDQAAAAEQDLAAFIRMFWHVLEPSAKFVEGWVTDAICDYLMAATDGHIKRGIINVFPGSLKSSILNIFWPAWEWGPCKMPWLRYISASYNVAIPERDNTRFARVINDPVYQRCWGQHVRLRSEGKELVENTKTGWKRTTSTHSGTTGHRGNRILIDDANDPNNVESETIRAATAHWLREVMPDRLNNLDDDIIINLQQRTHTGDATGVLAASGGGYSDNWMMIPMQFDPLRIYPVVLRRDENGEPEDIWTDPRALDKNGDMLDGLYTDGDDKPKVRMGSPMAKAEGALAFPDRFSPQAIARLMSEKQGYAWEGQYQQSPTTRGGAIIRDDWWMPWNEKSFPDMGTTICSLDTALEEKMENDFNALTIWGAFEGGDGAPKMMLMGAWQDKLPLAQLVARVAEFCEKFKVDYLLIEHKTRGRDVHDELRRLYQHATWKTILIVPQGSKTQRLNAVSILFSGDVKKMPEPGNPSATIDVWSGGMVYAPNTQWADDVIQQVSAFPRGDHDDYVDTVSQCLDWVRKNGVVVRKAEHDAMLNEKMRFKPAMKVPYVI